MAKISFARSGGSLEPSIHLAIDLDSLFSGDEQHTLYIIEDADFFHLAKNLEATHAVDEFLYSITEEAGPSRPGIHVSEVNGPDSWRPLLNELSKVAVLG